MIDERLEEQACLYVIGALPTDDAKAFEQALETNAELREFTQSLDEVSASLALTAAPAEPSPALREKILSSLPEKKRVLRPDFVAREVTPSGGFAWLPWALAACLAVCAIILFQQQRSLQTQLSSVTEVKDSVQAAADKVSVELDAEKRKLETATALIAQLKADDAFSHMRIAMLSSLLTNAPNAVAMSVWNPEKQTGVLVGQNLATLPSGKDYQLWMIPASAGGPVDAGTFSIDASGHVRFQFKPKTTVNAADKFAITIEDKGGVSAPKGKMVLAGTWL